MNRYFLLILLILLVGCQRDQKDKHNNDSLDEEIIYEDSRAMPQVDTILNYSITEDTIRINGEKPQWEISGYYPQILPDLPANSFSVINTTIKDTILSLVREWNNWGVSGNVWGASTSHRTCDFDYFIRYADTAVICMEFYMDFAHRIGCVQSLALTFDLKNIKEYHFAELFLPGADYQSVLTRLCINDMIRDWTQLESETVADEFQDWRLVESMDYENVQETPSSAIESWGINDSTLILYYYRMFYPSSCFYEALIPIDSLQSIANPNGPIGHLLEKRQSQVMK